MKIVVIFYVPAGDSTTTTSTAIDRYNKRNFKSFKTFKTSYSSIWKVEMPNDQAKWKDATCTCPIHLKQFICKHVIGIACRLKYCKIPAAAKNDKIGVKRKRGRTPKATKVLLRK